MGCWLGGWWLLLGLGGLGVGFVDLAWVVMVAEGGVADGCSRFPGRDQGASLLYSLGASNPKARIDSVS